MEPAGIHVVFCGCRWILGKIWAREVKLDPEAIVKDDVGNLRLRKPVKKAEVEWMVFRLSHSQSSPPGALPDSRRSCEQRRDETSSYSRSGRCKKQSC
ncbi:hypothetical protein N7461_007979 [Penicillium sp. DV-2018c]|nr:hypothetical protein N7461_007979 [Penicillium sp. DV-2018c]